MRRRTPTFEHGVPLSRLRTRPLGEARPLLDDVLPLGMDPPGRPGSVRILLTTNAILKKELEQHYLVRSTISGHCESTQSVALKAPAAFPTANDPKNHSSLLKASYRS
jgi:hypothetical protein